MVGGVILAFLLLTLNYIWVMLLVRRRGKLAHELNQPLSAIRHYAQGCLIRLRAADEQHPLLPALEQIDQQAQRGADTLRNLRHWVSQAQGNPVLTEAWNEVSAALRVTLPSVLLEQVLANIILNAAQAGATHLWVVAERTENGISIVLQDNAGGIDEALLRQAFQPFMTTRKSGTRPRRTVCRERWSRYISYMNMGAGMATIHLLDDDTAVTNACAFLLESLGYDVKCWTQGQRPEYEQRMSHE